MEFSLPKSIEILERTPKVLQEMLAGIADDWILNNEGEGTWSVFDVIGHLIHGEKTDWMVRAEIILSNRKDKAFQPFDRFAQLEESKGKSLEELLTEFSKLRGDNIRQLLSKNITATELEWKGVHPAFGDVTLAQLLATWTVHDLNHIAQISRIMAKQYMTAVGPWKEYLRILQ